MRAMTAAIAAPTVKTTQNNAMTENGIMAFTATSFPGRGAGGRGPDWRRGWLSVAVVAPGPLALPVADRHGGRQTGSRPILRPAAGICPRATYARMVDGATFR
jgi:hypothetical protein